VNEPNSDRSELPGRPVGQSPFAPGSPPFVEYYCPPRLGIIHLLAWTAATAVLLKFSMAMEMIGNAAIDVMSPAQQVFDQTIRFVYTTVQAAGIVGTSVLLLGKIRGAPGRLHPGHWIMSIDTVTSLLTYLLSTAYVLLEDSGGVNCFPIPWIFLPFGILL